MLFKKYLLPQSCLGVWELSEQLEQLMATVILDAKEQEKLAGIKNGDRKLEWLAVRALTNELTGQQAAIAYAETGKPFLKNSEQKISISHTKKFVSVIIDTYETGVDIQHLDPKIERIAHKFMSEAELDSINNTNRIEQLSVYWCAKESLYKLYGNKNLEFKKELFISPFQYSDSGQIKGTITKKDIVQVHRLCYEKIDPQTILVYILNE